MILAQVGYVEIGLAFLSPTVSVLGLLLTARYLAGRRDKSIEGLGERVTDLATAIEKQADASEEDRKSVAEALTLRAERTAACQSEQARQFSAVREERSALALRVAETYAPHKEVMFVIARMSEASARTDEKIDALHGRVTRVAEEVSRVAGLIQAGAGGASGAGRQAT